MRRRRCAQTPWKIALFTSTEEPEIDHPCAFEFVSACGAHVFVCLEMLELIYRECAVFVLASASIGVKKETLLNRWQRKVQHFTYVWCE
jgi:hypothetical protein